MREKAISRLLTDDYAEKILVATHNSPRSVQEISDKYDIPIAACYRKIHELEDAGFLKCAEIVTTPKGKTMKLYQATLMSAHLRYKDGSFKVKFEFDHDTTMNGKWIELTRAQNY
ncbi:MAG: winged helix-turn-helix domain-containing protein [Thermoplasmata archaeon]